MCDRISRDPADNQQWVRVELYKQSDKPELGDFFGVRLSASSEMQSAEAEKGSFERQVSLIRRGDAPMSTSPNKRSFVFSGGRGDKKLRWKRNSIIMLIKYLLVS